MKSLLCFGMMVCTLCSCASGGGVGGGRRGGRGARDIESAGVTVLFPQGRNCVPIASPYGSGTRFDGSGRKSSRYGGAHGGIDLSLPEGTPLRAISSGKVIHSGSGGPAEGIYLWMQHSPQDTGLGFWVYTKYQHLRELPAKPVGATIALGEVVALSGKTGTQGRAFGPGGYAHLHLTTFASESAAFRIAGAKVMATGGEMVDPTVIFLPGLADPDDVDELPEAKKKVTVAVVDDKGAASPLGSKVVWPVACP